MFLQNVTLTKNRLSFNFNFLFIGINNYIVFYVRFLIQNKDLFMKLNKNYIITGMFLFVLVVLIGCKQKFPDNFPQKLVPFEVKLTHNGSPIKWAAISFLQEDGNLQYLVTAYTNANGIAKMETTMNIFSKLGVPSGTYTVIITHSPTPPSRLPNTDLSKMNNTELNAYYKKIDAEIAAMPHPVPKEWDNLKTTPIKITVPEKGGTITIEITDNKTFVQ
jgi:hypothetical protein